ncbi:MAG TPA: TraR/DksA C4-type zinc finger protein [Streptosporangiaceae bacterium]|nr:TraR/DksA C4-type zinc finger protein [Streptosporangiaceae bacterium]
MTVMTATRQLALPGKVPAPRRSQTCVSRWRALLEARWQNRLEELTDLSVAFHDAAPPDGTKDAESRRLLSRRAVVARYALAETDKALHRLAAGEFGRCEDCADDIEAARLLAKPEARYCERCG